MSGFVVIIAGHTFTETPEGRRCHCGRRWVDIAGTQPDQIGHPHIAHVGCLTTAEYCQIEAERERGWALAMGFRTVSRGQEPGHE